MNDLNQILAQYQSQINSISQTTDLEKLRIELFGRNGVLADLFTKIKDIAPTEKKTYGQQLNLLKNQLETVYQTKLNQLNQQEAPRNSKLPNSSKYFTLEKIGHFHPITITERKINRVFKDLGFSLYHGPEIETDEFCFQRLNVPLDHPARELQDSIYIKEPDLLLRTQTSSIESRLLSQEKPPFKAAFPGRTYRNEKVNKSNHFIFHQYQGVAVNKNISLKDLFGTITLLFQKLYGPKAILRLRTKYYPEVEPGVGIDMQCFNCHGTGCPICKGAGWMEMGGAGLIHPKVLQMAGIDPTLWRGFAFGLGLDRWTMANFNIHDIRTLLGGNLAYQPYEK
jgi:phenylalanyl-tRNA synthetase alpha chain